MQNEGNEYVVVSFLAKDAPRTFSRSEWPLHVTIVRPFFSAKTPEELLEELRTASSKHAAMSVAGKSREMFGTNHDISVTELEHDSALLSLHADALEALKPNITFNGPDFKGYRPHVTDHGSGSIAVGEKVPLHSVSLVAMGAGAREILGTIELPRVT